MIPDLKIKMEKPFWGLENWVPCSSMMLAITGFNLSFEPWHWACSWALAWFWSSSSNTHLPFARISFATVSSPLPCLSVLVGREPVSCLSRRAGFSDFSSYISLEEEPWGKWLAVWDPTIQGTICWLASTAFSHCRAISVLNPESPNLTWSWVFQNKPEHHEVWSYHICSDYTVNPSIILEV